MTEARFRGASALVTGASSGIGEAFARSLADGGADLLLTGLPAERDRLDRTAAELSAEHGVSVEVVPMDLSDPGGPEALVEAADGLAFEPTILVNSAGVGVAGTFVEQPLERQLAMLRLNVLGVVALTGLYLPRMVERRGGVVVNVSSTAALQPLPSFAAYAASKAFVLSFGEALWAEAHAAGVRVVTVCPGPVSTGFEDTAWDAGSPATAARNRQAYLTPQQVVDAAFAAVEADRPRAVVRMRGGRVLFGAFSAAALFVPRRWEMLAIERVSRWLLPWG
jgi:short-subunit dehydrogenase